MKNLKTKKSAVSYAATSALLETAEKASVMCGKIVQGHS